MTKAFPDENAAPSSFGGQVGSRVLHVLQVECGVAGQLVPP